MSAKVEDLPASSGSSILSSHRLLYRLRVNGPHGAPLCLSPSFWLTFKAVPGTQASHLHSHLFKVCPRPLWRLIRGQGSLQLLSRRLQGHISDAHESSDGCLPGVWWGSRNAERSVQGWVFCPQMIVKVRGCRIRRAEVICDALFLQTHTAAKTAPWMPRGRGHTEEEGSHWGGIVPLPGGRHVAVHLRWRFQLALLALMPHALVDLGGIHGLRLLACLLQWTVCKALRKRDSRTGG